MQDYKTYHTQLQTDTNTIQNERGVGRASQPGSRPLLVRVRKRRAACGAGAPLCLAARVPKEQPASVPHLDGSCFGELQTSAEKLFVFFPSFSVFDAAFFHE